MADKKKNKKATSKAVKSKGVIKKTSVKKTAAKTSAKATPKNVKNPNSKKQTNKAEILKPDWDYENGTSDSGKIIIVGSKKNKPKKRSTKELRRAGQVGGYTAWDGKTGKTFATENEAVSYATDFALRTGEIISVTRTDRKVTHTFKSKDKENK